MIAILLIANLLLASYMTGLIWVIQLLVYPNLALLHHSDQGNWAEHHGRHTSVMGLLAGLPMCGQLGLAAWLLYLHPLPSLWLNAGLVLATWVVTFAWAVPIHQRLADQAEPVLFSRLLWANWVRTCLWSLQLGLAVYCVRGFY